jgi:hypothetical protein
LLVTAEPNGGDYPSDIEFKCPSCTGYIALAIPAGYDSSTAGVMLSSELITIRWFPWRPDVSVEWEDKIRALLVAHRAYGGEHLQVEILQKDDGAWHANVWRDNQSHPAFEETVDLALKSFGLPVQHDEK